MFVSQKTISFLSGVIAMLSLSACNGILEDIYDAPEPEDSKIYGFIAVDNATHTGRIYIDATDYTEWHYIDLHGKQVTTTAVGEAAPERWDFAVHRYDAKTNGGAVMESAAADFGMLTAVGTIPKEAFTADEWTTDKITVDMSQMMDGIIRYAEDWYNPVLSRWLRVDTSTMPPIYTLSGKVYLLRLTDGTCAALRLTNFMNDAAVKGFMTIDYLYPVQP
ncbi:HmuY family protein [uncultured Bacteroides sp.]|uniref:HmuY family protein n=1 Tax=uncultured Bacteroides sp. TaxID=162156 RepID=UPI0026137EF3|nr:HmuY family protein [uncultured Bacteroides sp.]